MLLSSNNATERRLKDADGRSLCQGIKEPDLQARDADFVISDFAPINLGSEVEAGIQSMNEVLQLHGALGS